ncbi:hypothetical protein [Acidithiobacillus sp.]
MVSYKIPSDLAEKQIEADVASYFGYMSPLFGKRLRLLDVNEQITGADKKYYRNGVAYYFQFKKPIGLRSTDDLKLPVAKRKNESKMMEIRRFRHSNKLDQAPYSICFPLHGDASTPNNQLQHNVLYGYEKPPYSRAMYICPMALSSEEYERAMLESIWRRWRGDPFLHHAGQTVFGLGAAPAIFTAPFLRGHATVVPHTVVSTPDHYYSFSKHATDIAFHSPELITKGPTRLSDFLGGEFLRMFREPETMVSIEDLARKLYEHSRSWTQDRITQLDDIDPLEWIQLHGTLLRKQFGIRQVIALADQQRLAEDNDRQ